MLVIYLIVACYQYFTWVFHRDFMNFGAFYFLSRGGKSNTSNTSHDFAHINKSERIFVTKLPSANVTQKLCPSYFTISYYTSLAELGRPCKADTHVVFVAHTSPIWELGFNAKGKRSIYVNFFYRLLFLVYSQWLTHWTQLRMVLLKHITGAFLCPYYGRQVQGPKLIASWIPMILLVWVGHSAVIRVPRCACVKLTLKGYSRHITPPTLQP